MEAKKKIAFLRTVAFSYLPKVLQNRPLNEFYTQSSWRQIDFLSMIFFYSLSTKNGACLREN